MSEDNTDNETPSKTDVRPACSRSPREAGTIAANQEFANMPREDEVDQLISARDKNGHFLREAWRLSSKSGETDEADVERMLASDDTHAPPFGSDYDALNELAKCNNLKFTAYDPESVYKPYENAEPGDPSLLYLFYIDIGWDGHLKVLHLLYDSEKPLAPGQKVEEAIDYTAMTGHALMKNPENEKQKHVSLLRSINFEGIYFPQKCYVAFVLGCPNWRFHSYKRDRAAIRFVWQDEIHCYGRNKYFGDGTDVTVDISDNGGGEWRSGFYMINHMKSEEETTSICEDDSHCHDDCEKNRKCLGKVKCAKDRTFKFDIFVDVTFGVRGVGPSEKTIIIDPTGENQGPPP